VRDLRGSASEAIISERQRRPFRSLGDLLERVELQAKEVVHLIQCGALDGLGASRAAMLNEAEPLRRAARRGATKSPPLQLALPFTESDDDQPPEQVQDFGRAWPGNDQNARGHELVRAAPLDDFLSLSPQDRAQRLAWEQRILGLPVSALAHPLGAVIGPVPDHLPLRRLGETPGRPVTVAGVRLPGWTGGPGFFLADGDAFVIAKGDKSLRAPTAWRPLVVRGRWLSDNWGNAWLQADHVTELQEYIE
jgi:hypothetical protein